MRVSLIAAALAGWSVLVPLPAQAQQIPRPDYLSYVPLESAARLPAGVDLSLLADWAMYFHTLGLAETGALDLVPEITAAVVREGDSARRHQFNFMLTLGF